MFDLSMKLHRQTGLRSKVCEMCTLARRSSSSSSEPLQVCDFMLVGHAQLVMPVMLQWWEYVKASKRGVGIGESKVKSGVVESLGFFFLKCRKEMTRSGDVAWSQSTSRHLDSD